VCSSNPDLTRGFLQLPTLISSDRAAHRTVELLSFEKLILKQSKILVLMYF